MWWQFQFHPALNCDGPNLACMRAVEFLGSRAAMWSLPGAVFLCGWWRSQRALPQITNPGPLTPKYAYVTLFDGQLSWLLSCFCWSYCGPEGVCVWQKSSISVTWSANVFPSVSWDVVTSGDCWRVLHVKLCWPTWTAFQPQIHYSLNNRTVMLVFATESGVVWAESWEATGLLENVFCSGLVSSLFFTCKIMFLEWIKMGARDLLRVNPEICVLWAASLESSKRELIAIVCFTIVCLDKGFILKSQKKPNF